MKFANLVNKKVVPTDNADEVEVFKYHPTPTSRREDDPRHVALTEKNGVRVSTVFLGMDHGWGDLPLWFETLVFEGKHDGDMERYTTYDEAVAGHAKMVKKVFKKKSLRKKPTVARRRRRRLKVTPI